MSRVVIDHSRVASESHRGAAKGKAESLFQSYLALALSHCFQQAMDTIIVEGCILVRRSKGL